MKIKIFLRRRLLDDKTYITVGVNTQAKARCISAYR